MSWRLKVAALCVCLAISCLLVSVCAAQQSNPTAPAPIPVQILSAKKVFIANGGGDESYFDAPQFSGGPNRAYNEFYAAMKAWGHHELVATPGDADLVFEIRLRTVQIQRAQGLGDNYDLAYDPQFRLVIRDGKTHETLWGLTEHAQVAVLQSNRDKNFERAMAGLIAEVKRIASPPPTPA
jgi:hypothetical protein